MRTKIAVLMGFVLLVAVLLQIRAFRVSQGMKKETAAEPDLKLPPWRVVCSPNGLYSFTKADGSLYSFTVESRELAEAMMLRRKNHEDFPVQIPTNELSSYHRWQLCDPPSVVLTTNVTATNLNIYIIRP